MKFKKYSLAEICNIQIGKTPRRDVKEYWGKGFSWLSISDMKSDVIATTKEEITESAVKKCGCKLIPEGTILMSFKLSIGKIAFAGKDLFTNEAIVGLEIKDRNILHPAYLFYVLKNIPLIGSNNAAMGATLNKESLKILQLPVPETISDQLHIANLLTKAENLISQRKQSIALLDEFIKSTFLEMFGDPVKNEKGWESNKTIAFTDCIVPGRDKPKSFTGITPWITTEDLINKGFVLKSNKNLGLSKEEIGEVRAKIIPAGSVVMTCVGDLGVLSVCKVDCVVNQQLHAFQCKFGMNNLFLMYSLSFQIKYMYKRATLTTVPYMNKTTCNSIPSIKPPIELQTQFAQIVEKIEALKAQYQISLQELENLYGSLSQRAFRGEFILNKGEEVLMAAEPEEGYPK